MGPHLVGGGSHPLLRVGPRTEDKKGIWGLPFLEYSRIRDGNLHPPLNIINYYIHGVYWIPLGLIMLDWVVIIG